MALGVDEIVDIVSSTGDVELDSGDVRISGAAMLEGRVTELLDVDAALLAADDQFFAEVEPRRDDARVEVA